MGWGKEGKKKHHLQLVEKKNIFMYPHDKTAVFKSHKQQLTIKTTELVISTHIPSQHFCCCYYSGSGAADVEGARGLPSAPYVSSFPDSERKKKTEKKNHRKSVMQDELTAPSQLLLPSLQRLHIPTRQSTSSLKAGTQAHAVVIPGSHTGTQGPETHVLLHVMERSKIMLSHCRQAARWSCGSVRH